MENKYKLPPLELITFIPCRIGEPITAISLNKSLFLNFLVNH